MASGNETGTGSLYRLFSRSDGTKRRSIVAKLESASDGLFLSADGASTSKPSGGTGPLDLRIGRNPLSRMMVEGSKPSLLPELPELPELPKMAELTRFRFGGDVWSGITRPGFNPEGSGCCCCDWPTVI